MMKKVVYGVIVVSVIASIVYSFSGGESDDDYRKRIENTREDRVKAMNGMKDSPLELLNGKDKALRYFPVDRNYQVKAEIIQYEEASYLDIPTSTGDRSKYLKYGLAKFSLHNTELRLMLLREFGTKRVLLAFADETSGVQTYGGGRYLDLEVGNQSSMTIDFNLAYNPYCAYSGRFSCPLPPKDNVLTVPIEAGEKMPLK